MDPDVLLAARPRWRGQRGRTEVWYATFTDPSSGTGGWLHAELVAPVGDSPPYRHGWIALFPPNGEPVVERFGPEPGPPGDGARWFDSEACTVTHERLTVDAPNVHAALRWYDVSPPLFTFPRVVWQRELLPGAQVVVGPSATFEGAVSVGDLAITLKRGIGAVAHIYGHGNAQRWGWLHADLGAGDVCEVVTAVSRRAALRHLPPLAFVQLRTGDQTWPRHRTSVLAARTKLRDDGWTVSIRERGRRLRIDVALPRERCVSLDYTDPDGATATCVNSERADATLTLERKGPAAWELEREWRLDGTAHAEIGTR